MLMWIALSIVIMFTFNSMIHSARDSSDMTNKIFFSLFSITLGVAYTMFCFRHDHILEYLIGAFVAVPISAKLDNKE